MIIRLLKDTTKRKSPAKTPAINKQPTTTTVPISKGTATSASSSASITTTSAVTVTTGALSPDSSRSIPVISAKSTVVPSIYPKIDGSLTTPVESKDVRGSLNTAVHATSTYEASIPVSSVNSTRLDQRVDFTLMRQVTKHICSDLGEVLLVKFGNKSDLGTFDKAVNDLITGSHLCTLWSDDELLLSKETFNRIIGEINALFPSGVYFSAPFMVESSRLFQVFTSVKNVTETPSVMLVNFNNHEDLVEYKQALHAHLKECSVERDDNQLLLTKAAYHKTLLAVNDLYESYHLYKPCVRAQAIRRQMEIEEKELPKYTQIMVGGKSLIQVHFSNQHDADDFSKKLYDRNICAQQKKAIDTSSSIPSTIGANSVSPHFIRLDPHQFVVLCRVNPTYIPQDKQNEIGKDVADKSKKTVKDYQSPASTTTSAVTAKPQFFANAQTLNASISSTMTPRKV